MVEKKGYHPMTEKVNSDQITGDECCEIVEVSDWFVHALEVDLSKVYQEPATVTFGSYVDVYDADSLVRSAMPDSGGQPVKGVPVEGRVYRQGDRVVIAWYQESPTAFSGIPLGRYPERNTGPDDD